jgi:site-specific recombinase XerD
MQKLCAAAKVEPKKVFPHNFRHLFAVAMYRMEKDIAKLADLLGHASIETTRIYIMESGAEHERQVERLGLVV